MTKARVRVLIPALALAVVAAGPTSGPVAQVAAAAAAGPGPSAALTAVTSPDIGRGGAVVFAAAGDLWLAPAAPGAAALESGSLVRITSGPAWDRDPAWRPDGSTIVFASDRSGTTDLWEIVPRAGGVARRLTESEEPDTEPSPAGDGRVVFVRGTGAQADLWLLEPDGTERQVTEGSGAELSPHVAPDSGRVVYVEQSGNRRSLRIRPLVPLPQEPESAPVEESSLRDGALAEPRFSPDGTMIAYSDSGARPGVWVSGAEGDWSVQVSAERAEAAWAPDGSLLLAEIARPDPGYNGDPDRLGDRRVGDSFALEGRLWWVPAPRPPGAGAREVRVRVPAGDAERLATFDRVFDRLRRLYGGDEGHGDAWEALAARLRPRAAAASSAGELEGVIYELLSSRPPAQVEATGQAAVSSAHPLASAAGVQVLAAGGNVVDAAVAVSFALGVVEPDASGLGGYGEMLVYLQGMERPVAIEFLTRAPEAAGLDNAALVGSRVPSHGPVLANVPGTVRGMELAWGRYGSGHVEWADLLAPAIAVAEAGFVLDAAFPTTLAREREGFLDSEAARELFFPGGEPLREGDTFANPALAATLREIASGGADAFYEGEIARRIVRDLRGQGNAITAADMARYFAAERPALEGSYRGHTIYAAAPAVSGGAALLSKLHLLDNQSFGTAPASFVDRVDVAHALIEAWKLGPSLNGLIADPGLWPVNLEPALDRAAAGARWGSCFDPAQASGPEQLRQADPGPPSQLACMVAQQQVAAAWGEDITACGEGPEGCRSTGTTSFAVADAAGNMVAVTQTLGTWGGNFYVTPGLGFLYNDKLGSYSSDPGGYGARLPNARNGTGIAPTLLFRDVDGRQAPWVAYGAAGNAWISSAVYQMTSGFVDAGLGPQAALELPRFLVGVQRDPRDRDEVAEVVVQIEDALSPAVVSGLRALGHVLQPISRRGELRMGYGAAVMVRDGVVLAGADPRRSGAAAALPGSGGAEPRR